MGARDRRPRSILAVLGWEGRLRRHSPPLRGRCPEGTEGVAIAVSCAPGFVDRSHDVSADAVNIAKHIIVPKPKDLPAKGVQSGIARPIAERFGG